MALVRLRSGRTGKTYDALNFDAYNFDLDIPNTVFPLPEYGADEAHLLKGEGNLKSVTLTWLVARPPRLGDVGTYNGMWPKVTLSTGKYAGDYYDVSNGTQTSGHGGWGTDFQRDYLETQFENISYNDPKDSIEVMNHFNPDTDAEQMPARQVPRNYKRGLFNKILLTIDSNEPLNYRATVSLQIGNVVVDPDP